MATVLDFLLFVGVIAAWTVAIRLLDRKGFLSKHNLVPVGPFLMVKTRRGRDFIDRSARFRRAWRVFGDISIVLVGLTMVGITALLIWEAALVRNIPPDRAPSPELLLGVPGLNPIIPVGYGVFALVIAVALHEFMHGILARVSKVKIESLGILLCILPIGAFVEPAEAEMKALPRRERARIYSVGAGINILLALLFGVLFSTMMLYGVEPVQPGIGIVGFTSTDAPALNRSWPAPMEVGSVIVKLNDTPTPSLVEFQAARSRTRPGDNVSVDTWKAGGTQRYWVVLGDDGRGTPILGIRTVETTPAFYHPFTDADRFGGAPGALLLFISLPFTGYIPLQSPTTDFYRLSGPWAAVPEPVFYLIANAMYWLFWLNLMLGATNALPAVPLDGGFVFRDGIEALLARVRRGLPAEKRDRVVRTVSYAFAVLILALILWQIIGPRLRF
jgi:membrane-associated protease RseP (regulator of RpoE activity)